MKAKRPSRRKAPEDLQRPAVHEYRAEHAIQAEKLCRLLAATDFEIGEFLGISQTTLKNWKIKYPEFRFALKQGKKEADERVERSLFAKATGYSYEAVKILVLKEMTVVSEVKTDNEISRTYREVVHHEPYTEHCPPDTVSCIFWLKNRQPDAWRDVKAVEHDIGKRLAANSEQQLDQRIAELLGKAGTSRIIDGEATPV